MSNALHYVSALSRYFKETIAKNPGMSEAIAAIHTLIQFIETSKGNSLLFCLSDIFIFSYIPVSVLTF